MGQTSFRFGTVGTPRSTPKNPGGSIGGIERLEELGLNCFEIGWVRSVRVSEETCLAIRETAIGADVAISIHAPYYINLNADEKEWPKSRQRLMDAAHYGHLAGATDIIFHPGSYFQKPADEVLEVALPRLEGCLEELRGLDNPVTLRPETMGKGAMLGSLEDTLLMSVAIEGVEPCIDFAHLHARAGDGSMNSEAEWESVLTRYAEVLGKESLKNLHCHVSGIEYTEKGEQNHLMLEESDFLLEDLLQALITHRCGGRILCESPVMEDDALVIKSLWEKLST